MFAEHLRTQQKARSGGALVSLRTVHGHQRTSASAASWASGGSAILTMSYGNLSLSSEDTSRFCGDTDRSPEGSGRSAQDVCVCYLRAELVQEADAQDLA